MEKIFIQSVLFSAAILVVYIVASPPLSLSAESEPAFDESGRVRKGTVLETDPDTQSMLVDFGGVPVLVSTGTSTTITSPNGSEAEISFFRDGSSVYVFGYYDSGRHSIEAEKIIMRNSPITGRKTPSRAESKHARKTGSGSGLPILNELRLTLKK